VVDEFDAFLQQLDVRPERFLPASARQGDNVVERGPNLAWYDGPTVVETLGLFRKPEAPEEQALRFPVQDVYKFDERRILAGRVAAGRVRVGDRLVFMPSYKSAHVRSIEAFNVDPPPAEATAGQSIGIILDEQIFVERGEIAAHTNQLPTVGITLRCTQFWMGQRPLELHRPYLLRLATREVECHISEIQRIVDATDLAAREAHTAVARNEVAELTIRMRAPIAFDLHRDFEVTGRFVLVDNYDVAGGGIITAAVLDALPGVAVERAELDGGQDEAQAAAGEAPARFGQRPALVLVTGDVSLANAAARELERQLAGLGHHAYLLDQARTAGALDADLGGADEEQRRFASLVSVLLDSGILVFAVVPSITLEQRRIIELSIRPAPVVLGRVGEGDEGLSDGWDVEPTAAIDVDALVGLLLNALHTSGALQADVHGQEEG
jgi:bifunctional enzyme CysN/CysC